ncbi:MAG TPA: Gfo/Idh/MocA family oxidoreductase [Solirubrobacterales bacterium]|nr:Gfo/Idh/MocA family oxidoreductase [Solirubrobacterales bacterium]
MRLGVAGCGRIVELGYIPAALAAEGVTIVAFADPNAERRERCRKLWGGEVQGFPDLASLLEAEPIDLLVVAAPLQHHLPLAEEAAAAGLRSLVEKPPTPDLPSARQLAALDPEPLLAFNRRFLQGEELRHAIPAEGWLELDLELRFQRQAWGAHEARDEALLDAGIHLIDLATHLSNATPIAVRHALVEPERAELELELSRGRARIRCATDRSHRETIEVRDRAGRTLARSTWGGLRSRLGGLLGRPSPLVISLQRQLEAVGVSLMEPPHLLLPQGPPDRPLATALDGATAMAVVEAARRSAELGGAEVTVAPQGAPA